MFGSEAVFPECEHQYVTDHILAEVEVFDPDSCYVTPHATAKWSVTDVSRSRLDGEVIEEFTVRGDGTGAPPATADDGVEKVFSYENAHVFRVVRPAEHSCVCEQVERAGCVLRDITVDEDSIVVTFLVDGTETLKRVLDRLEETGGTLSLRRLIDSSAGQRSGTPMVLDPDVLTDRQAEVLEVAHEMGYFEHPRDASAGEVADELGIATTTFTEHLAAAQRKLLGDVVAD
ncbi:helix-turn-helix domain-containing protein [Haloarcula sp. S1CR25-12]|uniref:Helix-turn-helix domain-containing protein n=1 Tax=Haloarcula saliterrae TaxID=2950534 RepID=A0ABU2FHD2_9EURY|nr:helix-turn-helix domain-containing protein [Haloarcula sp. S1CR25-12]MDS0261235.1 helix-turn-helix domain-containing protein [Haloarcula sp. S1CR25-12]